MNIEEKVLKIFVQTLSLKRSIKNPDKIKWDSLKHINLITNLEVEFNIIFEPEEISEMVSYSKMCKIISKKLKRQL